MVQRVGFETGQNDNLITAALTLPLACRMPIILGLMDSDSLPSPTSPTRSAFPWFGLGVCGLGLAALAFSLSRQLVSPGDHSAPTPIPTSSAAQKPAPTSEPERVAPRLFPKDRFADIPVVSAPVSDVLRIVADRNQTEDARLQPLVDGNLPLISEAQDIALIRRILRDPNEGDTLRNEAANLLNRSEVGDLASDLIRVLNQDGEQARFRSFAAQHLGVLWNQEGAERNGASYDRLLACLNDRHIEVQREAMLALARGNEPSIADRVATILTDSQPQRLIDLACRIAAEKNLRDNLPAIRALRDHQNQVVARAAQGASKRLAAASEVEQ